MGKFSGHRPGKGGKKSGGGSGWPAATAAPVEEDDEMPPSDEEEELEEGDLPSDFDGDEEEVDEDEIEQQINAVKTYAADPLAAFYANPQVQADDALKKKINDARKVITESVDPLLAPTSSLADEYRKMELAQLARVSEKLYVPRGKAARKEAATMEADDLKVEGTGLMWSVVFNAVCDSIGRRFPSHPFEFTDRDETIFNHCVNVVPSYIDNDPFVGITFEFEFAKNPFFTNNKLSVSFRYACPSLALGRVGIEYAAICGVHCNTPVQWKPGNEFETMPSDMVDPAALVVQQKAAAAFFTSKSTSDADNAALGRLMLLWPRPFFSALFETATPRDMSDKLVSALTKGRDGECAADNSPHGAASVRAGALDMIAWVEFVTAMSSSVRAPMITVMDQEAGDNEFGMGDDDDEEEEEEEEEEDEDDEDEPGATRGAPGKKARSEKKAPPPQECKQQ